jgi:hypothetical protein
VYLHIDADKLIHGQYLWLFQAADRNPILAHVVLKDNLKMLLLNIYKKKSVTVHPGKEPNKAAIWFAAYHPNVP